MHLKIRMVQVLVWQLKCYCTLSLPGKHWSLYLSHKRERVSKAGYKLWHCETQKTQSVHSLCKLSPLTQRSLTPRPVSSPITDAISCYPLCNVCLSDLLCLSNWLKKNTTPMTCGTLYLFCSSVRRCSVCTLALNYPLWMNSWRASICKCLRSWLKLQQL